MTTPTCLAVDGGGTRCRIAVLVGDDRHHTEVGSANVTTSLDGALAEIARGMALLSQTVGQRPAQWQTVPVYLGLAGVTDRAVAAAVAERLAFDRVRVEDDRPAAVHGALGSVDGGVLHCGTGSFQAIQQAGCIRTVGGWGAVLGDPASAMWLGREALTATLAVFDDLRPASPLTHSLIERFGSATGIVRFARDALPADFGALAPDVTQAADDGDAVAVELMQCGAELQSRTLTQLGWAAPVPLCFTGGLAAQYRAYLPEAMQRAVQPPQGTSLDGAVGLAQQFAVACAHG